MGSFDLHRYVDSRFLAVERGPAAMHEYQNTAVKFLIDNPYSALFIDMGLGKTCISLTAVLNLVTRFECNHCLVIAPRRVANETWPTEIGLWRHTAPLSYVHVREEEVVEAVNRAGQETRSTIKRELTDELIWEGVSRSTIDAEVGEHLKSDIVKARIETARIVASRKAVREHFRNNPATVHIINREQVEFLVNAWGRDWPYDTVIVDESSCLKDHTTGRFKALKRVRPLMKRMHQLTATPAAETYLHLFPQIYLLDLGARFGKSVTAYREKYFTQNRYTFKWMLRPGAEEQISEKIADICLVMKADDYLDLEKPTLLYDKVYLSESQMALYNAMLTDFVITLPSGREIEADTAAALSQKLLQMVSGVIYETVLDGQQDGSFKKKRIVHQLHDHKIDALQAIVEEAQGEPILVAYWHDSSPARLTKAFPKAVLMDKDGKCVKPWNAGKIPIMLVHPQSAGHGLNLQYGGRRIVFFDIPWSLELYMQTIGRLARQGQKHVVLVHHLIADGTIDEDVVQCLSAKHSSQELLFTLLRRIRRRLLLST